ncbi:hypothetical protein ACU686_10270 [Yinghuangia aomiensis]
MSSPSRSPRLFSSPARLRTGTSILHALLAQDPANRVPQSWRVLAPWCPARPRDLRQRPRLALVERELPGRPR